VMAVVATRNVGSAVAFLALTWSTVVLLGGFISELRVKEFWFLGHRRVSYLSTYLAS
jgi:hypothetical protein